MTNLTDPTSAKVTAVSSLPGVSVVIATLGTSVLGATLDALAKIGSLVQEVLVIYPRERTLEVDPAKYDSRFKFIPFAGKGQVSQRTYGFNLASSPLVLQMDDDGIIDAANMEKLVTLICRLGKKAVVAPVWFDPKANKYVAEIRRQSIPFHVATGLLLGFKFGLRRMGTVSKAGSLYPVNPLWMQADLLETEWVPGGCALHWNENLVRHNYFPFEGRACLEDAMHCYLLRQKGIRTYMARDITINGEGSNVEGIQDLLEITRRAMKYLNVLRGMPTWRVDVWYYLAKLRQHLTRNSKV